jgi:hypothetical protein
MSIIDKLLLRPVPNVEELYKNSRIDKEFNEILKILAIWGNNSTNLWRWHIILGTMATIFSILAATGLGSATQIFGFLAAVSISLLTAFNLGAKSNNTRNAWRELNTAVMRFNQNIIQRQEVIDAYERGETMIGGVIFNKEAITLSWTGQQERQQQQQERQQQQQERQQQQQERQQQQQQERQQQQQQEPPFSDATRTSRGIGEPPFSDATGT